MTFPDLTPAPSAISRILDAPDDRPFVVGQLGQSLDGRIATPTGKSQWINGKCALTHLHAVRAAIDAIVVGVGTVVADDPQLNVRLVERLSGLPQPTRVVLDPRGRAPHNAKCFDLSTGGPAVQLVCSNVDVASPRGCQQIQLDCVEGRFDPLQVVQKLFELGHRKVLIEGGASTVSAFVEADALDHLHLLVAPLLLGSGKSGVCLSPIDEIREARRPACETTVFKDGDVLFDCDLRACVAAS